jgi:hypothetical protein
VGLPTSVGDLGASGPALGSHDSASLGGGGGGGGSGGGLGRGEELRCNSHWEERFGRNATLEFSR